MAADSSDYEEACNAVSALSYYAVNISFDIIFYNSYLAELVYAILYRIPLINAIPYFANMPLPFLFGLSAIQGLTTALILYLAITSFMGLYSYIPWVSDIININTGRK